MELKDTTPLRPWFRSSSRIHSMELKGITKSMIAYVVAPRIHSMELKGIQPYCMSDNVVTATNPFNGIERGLPLSSTGGMQWCESIQWN